MTQNKGKIRDIVVEVFAMAKDHYEKEMESLMFLNKQKAIKEISELYNLNAYDLLYYIEHGEEKTKIMINALN